MITAKAFVSSLVPRCERTNLLVLVPLSPPHIFKVAMRSTESDPQSVTPSRRLGSVVVLH